MGSKPLHSALMTILLTWGEDCGRDVIKRQVHERERKEEEMKGEGRVNVWHRGRWYKSCFNVQIPTCTQVRTGRVKVDSYSSFLTSGATLLLPGHGSESEEEAATVFDAPSSRVPPPPREVEYVRVRRGPATRWVELRGRAGGGTEKYVMPPSLEYARGERKGQTSALSPASA
ncbi:hypothetical protein F5148DRAFT_1368789 [Russula earlei]|uniref:Uncharacterized protein n=1 Tax=Russula earlei TaxID=71964 RepID=A0ACC0U6Y1_9AGAM|nr:hypothetical protein F5148DRAFT_1368789 [Russula earlei]